MKRILRPIRVYLRISKIRSIRYYFNLLNHAAQENKIAMNAISKMITWINKAIFIIKACNKERKMKVIMRSQISNIFCP